MASRTSAQQRADEIRVFRLELARLEQEGALELTGAQREKLTQHQSAMLAQYAASFDIDRDLQSKQLSLGMRVASFLGALALAASVFFLFYQFWGLLSEPLQVAILLVAALGTFLLTMWARGRDETGYFTNLCAMVAFACFVLNLTMLGRAFNITPSDNALIVWAALAFLLAYTCDSRLLLAAGILCVMGFIAARVGAWRGMYWLDLGERPENFFPAAILFFLLPQFVNQERFGGFASIYRVFGLLALFLSMLVLGFWGDLSYLDFSTNMIESVYQVLGFAFSAAAVWFGARRHWPAVVNTGVTFFVIFLYTKLFDWWWETMPKYLFFLVLGLTALLILLILRRLRKAVPDMTVGGERT
jgi:uncharacterized membrane protein